MASDSDKQIAEVFRQLNPDAYTGRSDDDVIAAAKVLEGENFGMVASKVHGSYVAPVPEKTGEDAFNTQHPIVKKLDDLSGAGNAIGDVLGKAVDLANRAMKPAMDAEGSAMDQIPGLGMLSLKNTFKLGQGIRDAGSEAVDWAENRMTKGVGNIDTNNFARSFGIIAQNSPLPASPGELVIQAGAEGVMPLAAKLGSYGNALAAKIPGVKPFMDMDKAAGAFEATKKSYQASLRDAAQTVDNIKEALKKLSDRINPTQDSIEYGIQSKRQLEASTNVGSLPLKNISRGIQEETKNMPTVSVEHLAPTIAEIKSDLLGFLKTSPDSQAVSIIEKYLGVDVVEKQSGMRYNSATKAFEKVKAGEVSHTVYPEVSVQDLLKDRGRIGKGYVKALGEAERETAQSTALKKLQGVLDEEIDARLSDNPELRTKVSNVRNGWQNFYDTFYSKEANGIRSADPSQVVGKILKSEESIDMAKKLMPDSLEQAKRVEGASILRDMAKSSDPVQYLKDTLQKGSNGQPGYYQRLFNEADRANLEKFAEVETQRPLATKRLHDLAEAIDNAKITGRRGAESGVLPDRRAGSKAPSLYDLASSFQGSRAAVPVEAITMGTMLHWMSPTAAQAVIAAGVTPAALAWAYYSVPAEARASILSAVKNVSDMGTKAPGAQLQMLRQINRYEPVGDKKSKELKKAELGKLSSLQEPNPLPSDIPHDQPGFTGTIYDYQKTPVDTEEPSDLGSLFQPGYNDKLDEAMWKKENDRLQAKWIDKRHKIKRKYDVQTPNN